jgi:hypothetical protein
MLADSFTLMKWICEYYYSPVNPGTKDETWEDSTTGVSILNGRSN